MSNELAIVTTEIDSIMNHDKITADNIIDALTQGVLVMRRFNKKMNDGQKQQTLLMAVDVLIQRSGDDPAARLIFDRTAAQIVDKFMWFATSGIKVRTSCFGLC